MVLRIEIFSEQLRRFPGYGVQCDSLFSICGLGIRGVPEPRFGA